MAHELHSSSPADLKQRIDLERRGVPFLLLRDGEGEQRLVELGAETTHLTVGRRPDNDVALTWDPEVSRVHAELARIGGDWIVSDDGLSRNGTFVNGERVIGRRRLREGDRLCFGETPIRFCHPVNAPSLTTAGVDIGAHVPVTATQRAILIALCRPLETSAYGTPASNREIAVEVHLSVDAVKAHLRVLFERFGLDELPQNAKRAKLAGVVLVSGTVSPRDF
jgi:pSer/pThr/pTyr-binding forkhead associated (FHA) protein